MSLRGPPATASRPAGVLIGRNEGARLVRALAAAQGQMAPILYVDSGSTDDSVAAARAAGAQVVALDMARPFTAARARNAGVDALRAVGPLPALIQFVDGDCALEPGWTATAAAFLARRPDVAIVAGRVRELHPEASVYNRLCDAEWAVAPGEAVACGGIFMIRSDAFDAVGGFDPTLIAGEEPDLCRRLRRAGWRIWQLPDPMVRHDAAMTRLSQWWTRTRRGGFAAAEGARRNGAGPDRQDRDRVRRALVWGLGLPAAAVAGTAIVGPAALALLLAYPAQIVRLARRRGGGRAAWEWAFFITLAKLPEALGVLGHARARLTGRRAAIIEWKPPPP